jgi:tetratricopeptide (TPR) repeat protein
VTKAPDSPRANADYANTLCEANRSEEALEYAEKAIKLGKKGREAGGLAMNAITIVLIRQGKLDKAIERNEEFFRDTNGITGDSLPYLCLNLATACISEGKLKEAYKWTLTALKYVQQTDDSAYKKDQVENVLASIFADPDSRESDFNGDGATGRGDMPAALRVAEVFKKHGEGRLAREIIEREYAKAPDDPRLKARVEDFQREDARNSAQKKKWNFSRKYIRNPFSKFNFNFAMAFLVQERHLPKVFLDWGERRLDAALQITPGSSDALLLKGWYLYNRDDAQDAVAEARKVLAMDPENSNAWLALGFFLAGTGDSGGAIASFEKVIEIYPGYPKRPVVEDLCRQLRQGGSVKSASNVN